MNRKDLEEASKLIKSHFRRFGLSIHCGDKRKNEKSKTEVMHIPTPGKTSTPEETEDVMLNENEFFGFCTEFKYLGMNIDVSMDNSNEIKKGKKRQQEHLKK